MNTMLRPRRLGGLPRPRLRRPRPLTVIALALALAALLIGGYLWVRDSSLVAVRNVVVVGASGRDAGKIRSALIAAARTMTTLDVNTAALHRAVAPYSEVKAIHVSTSFPHGMRIVVVEEYAVATIVAGGQQTGVGPDGVLLHGVAASTLLPALSVGAAPRGARLRARPALDELAVLAAAPYQFIPRIAQASEDATHGVALQLRSGPAVYFGDTSRLAAKWRALVAVLADPGSAGATYIDVSDPLRPAAGGTAAAAQAAIAAGLAQTGTSTVSSQTPPVASGTGTTTGTLTGASTGTSTATSTGTATATTSTGATPTSTTAAGTATAPPPTTTAAGGTATTGGSAP
jgi:cell division protein FtsQ